MDVLGIIPYDDNVLKAMAKMKPLVELYPQSPASIASLRIASRVEERVVKGWSEWFREYKP